ncbi:hypothetical protein VOLCADRAFT_106494 [Volvox carteri f. nagariensis]|uniref:Glycosyltransferase n=1 Tax=Volvox carteri f. nagariensis TaxID=3068 RepID=D8U7R5_VOLCA|nr:uncharacterized protein VOLCADRAFT_106494 [Volvox carteri f. nagariensis]EFJ44348.1 hypothetical protein VOLCADRAFT_106494 [Volvox carteri f. nagariensis]|eukprot:XP_002954707.1 hypothetical protein VOLCADRAFT_106494 [Volvox carteri f. nagariensis]
MESRSHWKSFVLLVALISIGWLHGFPSANGNGLPKQQAMPQRPAEGGAKAVPSTTARAQAGAPPAQRTPVNRGSISLPNWCSVGTYARNGEPLFTTMTRTEDSHKVYHNAFWHAHKWYALVPPDAMFRDGDQPGTSDTPLSTSSTDATTTTSSVASHPPSSQLEEGLSVNCALINLPVSNISSFTDNMRTGFLPGTTLLVDFPFPAFPDNLGHWAEIMLTTYSVLMDGAWRSNSVGTRGGYVDRILLPNLRKEMNDWFKEILAIAVAPGVRKGGAPVPPIIDHADLEAFPKLSWLAIENLLVVQDRDPLTAAQASERTLDGRSELDLRAGGNVGAFRRLLDGEGHIRRALYLPYTHPERKTGFIGADHGDLWRYDGCGRYVNRELDVGFSNASYAAAFRAAAYKRAGLDPPASSWVPGSPPPPPLPGSPRVMTLLLPHEDYPPVVNWQEVQEVLRRVGTATGLEVRTVTLSTDAPFVSHLDTFARSSVLVARHGPLLATATLMAPGSAVVELLPYKWEWLGLSKLYYNMTQSAGDLHHFAWRATDHRLVHYDHENYTRYHSWTPEECSARECLMVHARAGLTVNTVGATHVGRYTLWCACGCTLGCPPPARTVRFSSELESLLRAKLPDVVAGGDVGELREPWPKAV